MGHKTINTIIYAVINFGFWCNDHIWPLLMIFCYKYKCNGKTYWSWLAQKYKDSQNSQQRWADTFTIQNEKREKKYIKREYTLNVLRTFD